MLAGPVNITCLASARPGRMWAMSTDRVTLVDITAGRFEPLAALPLPGVDPIADAALAELAATELSTVEQTTSPSSR